jgi:hypothetical protein
MILYYNTVQSKRKPWSRSSVGAQVILDLNDLFRLDWILLNKIFNFVWLQWIGYISVIPKVSYCMLTHLNSAQPL